MTYRSNKNHLSALITFYRIFILFAFLLVVLASPIHGHNHQDACIHLDCQACLLALIFVFVLLILILESRSVLPRYFHKRHDLHHPTLSYVPHPFPIRGPPVPLA